METYQKQDILLESGTNEMEIIEFYLGTQPFGINVHKLKEIIPFDPDSVTAVPGSSDGMLGTLLLRGSTIPLIDLKDHVSQRNQQVVDEVRCVVLVCEFNNRINGFKVDGVNQIHRVSWDDIQPMAEFIDQYRPRFTGSVNIDGREILIVDLEHIVAEFDDEAALNYDEDSLSEGGSKDRLRSREGIKVLLAEDSSLIRAGIEKVLKSAGYSAMQTFVDGHECYAEIERIKKRVAAGEKLEDLFNLLITDIEMPRLDGLTLCRRVKEDAVLKDTSVVLFSSLINEQMAAKCDQVGADGYATKPQIPYLVEMIDRLLGIE